MLRNTLNNFGAIHIISSYKVNTPETTEIIANIIQKHRCDLYYWFYVYMNMCIHTVYVYTNNIVQYQSFWYGKHWSCDAFPVLAGRVMVQGVLLRMDKYTNAFTLVAK